MNYSKVADQIVRWIKGQVEEAGAYGLVVGLSGGIDSSVAAVLSQKAVGSGVLGLIIPCAGSKTQDRKDAEELSRAFGIPVKTLLLTKTFDVLCSAAPEEWMDRLPKANLKSRLRMCALYLAANARNALVVGTSNKTEIVTGYYTKYGDGGVDLEPIGDLYKTEIRELAAYLGVPQCIIDKAPSAGLWEGQTDEGELGITYEALDKAIDLGQVSARIEALIDVTEHKRHMPPTCVLEASDEDA